MKLPEEKTYLTYNQQMKKLRDDKRIECSGTVHKRILVRTGYFNIVNGYKSPFTCGKDQDGNHLYLPGTSIDQLYIAKKFDDEMRALLLKQITSVEEEVRALTSYKIDEYNEGGRIHWFEVAAYDQAVPLQRKMNMISRAYNELSKYRLGYVKFYMDNHSHIPTWIMLKAVSFSSFIDILHSSKPEVKHSICKLYGITDENGLPNVKLLIGSLHWMRQLRNSCAHNERIYCLEKGEKEQSSSGRIKEKYIKMIGKKAYLRPSSKRIFDLLVYMKYYLPDNEYRVFMTDVKRHILSLREQIDAQAFNNVRGKMGIKNVNDLDILIELPKEKIDYNRFDRILKNN